MSRRPAGGPAGGEQPPRPRRTHRLLLELGVAAAVIAADQASKALIRAGIAPGGEERLLPGLSLVHDSNEGVAFGVKPGGSNLASLLLALTVVLVVLYLSRRSRRPALWLASALIVGGAIGNIIDRLRAGAVTDFIKLPLGWPPFNLADSAITLGVILAAYLNARQRPPEQPKQREQPQQTSEQPGQPQQTSEQPEQPQQTLARPEPPPQESAQREQHQQPPEQPGQPSTAQPA